jgi:hypothetical protein
MMKRRPVRPRVKVNSRGIGIGECKLRYMTRSSSNANIFFYRE